MKEKQYAVLGLGVFGSTIAKTLSQFNCEVIAIDLDMECVQRLADVVTQSIRGDITDINVLRNANVGDCDVAIVAVGSHLEQSIMAVMNLKELGVPIVVAKAKNKVYKQILEKIGADKVVRPEKEMGVVTAKGLLNRNIIEMVDLDDKYSVMEVNVPAHWIGKTMVELDVRNKYGINIMGIRYEDQSLEVNPSPEYKLQQKDHLFIISDLARFNKLGFLEK